MHAGGREGPGKSTSVYAKLFPPEFIQASLIRSQESTNRNWTTSLATTIAAGPWIAEQDTPTASLIVTSQGVPSQALDRP